MINVYASTRPPNYVLTFSFQMILRHKESTILKTYLLVFVTLICFISSVSAVAVRSVDLGTEWMKVAVVSVSSS